MVLAVVVVVVLVVVVVVVVFVVEVLLVVVVVFVVVPRRKTGINSLYSYSTYHVCKKEVICHAFKSTSKEILTLEFDFHDRERSIEVSISIKLDPYRKMKF